MPIAPRAQPRARPSPELAASRTDRAHVAAFFARAWLDAGRFKGSSRARLVIHPAVVAARARLARNVHAQRMPAAACQRSLTHRTPAAAPRRTQMHGPLRRVR